MDATAHPNAGQPQQHKRTTSSVLKSMMPRNYQRKPTSTPSYSDWDEDNEDPNAHLYQQNVMLPPGHPHTRGHLREDSGNRNQKATSPRKSVDLRRDSVQTSGENRKMTQSSSFKAFEEKGKASKKNIERDEKPMKKSKSSTSLSTLLSRPRSSKGLKAEEERRKKEKENQTPPTTAKTTPPPIWAQFATTQGALEPSSTTKIPLNDRRSVDGEISRYAPQAHSPSKQRNFETPQKPTLSKQSASKPRPKSECLAPRPTAESFAETVSGLRRSDRYSGLPITSAPRQNTAKHADVGRQALPNKQLSTQRLSIEQSKISDDSAASDLTMSKRGSRVMAAVVAFNSKTKELPEEPVEGLSSIELDPLAIETAFESLLDARNVPQNTRHKMRSLDTNIKADFIKKDKFGSGSASSTEGLSLQSSRPDSRPNTGNRSKTDDISMNNTGEYLEATADTPKKSRPRSRTFTFSKGDQSPSKKQKAERPTSQQRTKSGDLTPSASSKLLTSAGAAQGMAFFTKVNKPAAPEDYITYLRKVQQPEKVEVGKIHKLRQLLRNETVGWVDGFITQGGMTELVELLYRIIKVEWRVEHEDALLHETLLCMKALSTTSSALHQLSDLHSTLFPVLLGMLFDKEKKGPSEFTTRGVIVSLLSTYLTSAASSSLADRARTILSYLQDPSGPEESQPPGFIASIYHSRPYRVWNKEIDSVIKEVFWIFLHHVNIIPYPELSKDTRTYTERHFPREHPPVPAAPYIGGVEWDATNYLTAHLDLLNGIIASLPTREERNKLRQELKDSSFEKVMGISLRTCKEKFYGCVHEALSTWVGAAMEDGWPYQDVRQGPKQEERKMMSPKKSPKKKDAAPRLEMPKLDLGVGGVKGGMIDDGGWL